MLWGLLSCLHPVFSPLSWTFPLFLPRSFVRGPLTHDLSRLEWNLDALYFSAIPMTAAEVLNIIGWECVHLRLDLVSLCLSRVDVKKYSLANQNLITFFFN